MSSFIHLVRQLENQRRLTERQLEKLNLAIKALASLEEGSVRGGVVARRKPQFTKAGLARIAVAQRKRWAKIKATQKK